MWWWVEDLIDDGIPTPSKAGGFGLCLMFWAAGIAVVMFIVNFVRYFLGDALRRP